MWRCISCGHVMKERPIPKICPECNKPLGIRNIEVVELKDIAVKK